MAKTSVLGLARPLPALILKKSMIKNKLGIRAGASARNPVVERTSHKGSRRRTDTGKVLLLSSIF